MPSLHAFFSSLLPFSSLVYLIMSGPLRNRDGKDTGWRWRGSGVGGEKVKTRIDRRNVLDGIQSINQSVLLRDGEPLDARRRRSVLYASHLIIVLFLGRPGIMRLCQADDGAVLASCYSLRPDGADLCLSSASLG